MNPSGRASLLFALAFGLFACDAPEEVKLFTKQVPDLTQTAIKGETAGDGQMYCAPVAVSNTFAWLLGVDTQDQLLMARTLAGQDYMRTSLKNGTGTVELLRGAKRYARSSGLHIEELQHEGWRKTDKSHFSGNAVPTRTFVERFVGDNRGAWVNIGWYKRDGSELRRIGGHWVTLVGADFSQGTTLYVNDPSPRAGNRKTTHMLSVSRLDPIRLIGRKHGLPRNGADLWMVEDGLKIHQNADVAIIDGIVGLKISRQLSKNSAS